MKSASFIPNRYKVDFVRVFLQLEHIKCTDDTAIKEEVISTKNWRKVAFFKPPIVGTILTYKWTDRSVLMCQNHYTCENCHTRVMKSACLFVSTRLRLTNTLALRMTRKPRTESYAYMQSPLKYRCYSSRNHIFICIRDTFITWSEQKSLNK